MDQLTQPDAFIQTKPTSSIPPPSQFSMPPNRSQPNSSQMTDGEFKDCTTARKMQKAGREKLRRDRLNEQFIELGTVLDPDRPKNDKATILTDTIQLLKDLNSQVDKLKADYATLTEESRELTQEKNDLREEKASIRSDVENLNAQYQQRLQASYPWAAMDHSVVTAPPSYPFPVPMLMPPGTIPMHPSMQPYPFFGNPSTAVVANPCSTFIPYLTPNALVEPQSTQFVPPFVHPGNQPHKSSKHDSKNKSRESRMENSEGSNEVTTDLELKTPGCTTEQELTVRQRKCKRTPSQEISVAEQNSSSRCSSSRSVQDSSSNSVFDGRNANDKEHGKTNKKNRGDV